MSPKLKPLILPRLVEERRKRESMPDNEGEMSTSFYTMDSSNSELTSPLTPTFSTRGHLRATSSTSSVDLPAPISGTESPSSPAYSTKGTKSPLPDVIEEPQEKEDHFDFLEDGDDYDCLCDAHCFHRDDLIQSTIHLGTVPDMEYDLADGFFSDGEYSVNNKLKKTRTNDSPFSTIASRIGTRFPSFSRTWRSRKNTVSSINTATSYAPSSRSSSISNSVRRTETNHLPPTPTRSVYDEYEDQIFVAPIDIEKANSAQEDRDEFPSTPLLPPLISDMIPKQTPVHSPLQSPTVAEPGSALLRSQTSLDGLHALQASMPSPPLSTKPSTSSFHRGGINRMPTYISTPDLPPFFMHEEDDEWANKLGHANFNIQPEPYLPETFDVEACRQLRADWDLARCNYTKHLVRIGEHYGATSKTYKLTEEKWASIETQWRKNNEATIQRTAENSEDAFRTLKHSNINEIYYSNIMTKIPSLSDARNGGKFPQLGDEDIVGPMVQVAAQFPRVENKKTKLLKFFAGRFPATFGKTLP